MYEVDVNRGRRRWRGTGVIVGKVVSLSRASGAQGATAPRLAEQNRPLESSAMGDLLGVCSDVIGSTIAGRIRELGGSDRDVREIAKSAAFAIFVQSAGNVFGDC